MTIDEFLVKLAETPGPWVQGPDRCLRMGNGGGPACCPITAVEAHRYGAGNWQEAADSLKLSRYDAIDIMKAADNSSYQDQALRARLLAATVKRP